MERVGVRTREPGTEGFEEYAALYNARKDFVARQHTAPLVIKAPKPKDYELCPQGLVFWYLHSDLRGGEQCLPDWYAFIHDIRGVSGRHRHQGGLILFIIEGEGYTTMNGVRYDWKAGDMILMPLLPEGVEHQHFNTCATGNSKWLAFIHTPTWNDVGSELVQTALDPEWVQKSGLTTWDGASVAKERLESAAGTAQ